MNAPIRILFLEDQQDDVMLVKRALDGHYANLTFEHARSHPEYVAYLRNERFDAVISDHDIPGCEDLKAFHIANDLRPGVPFLFLSGRNDAGRDLRGMRGAGVSDFVPKAELKRLPAAIDQAIAEKKETLADTRLVAGYQRLVRVVKDLSFARDMAAIMAIVRTAARELTGADGATFILREGDLCHYADEDAIGPLWKGQKFPADACISGWSMLHRQPAVVEDIYSDPRVPLASYEPTFVRSVAMVPIRSMEPLGAIGTYWSVTRVPQAWEIRLLQALADTTAVAIENVRIRTELEQRVQERTAELEAFSFAVSHDLRTPLRHIRAHAAILLEDHGDALNEGIRYNVQRILSAGTRMSEMIEGLLQLHLTSRAALDRVSLDLAQLARDVAGDLERGGRPVEFACPASLPAFGDPTLLRIVLQNLLGNAWKFTGKTATPRVELGTDVTHTGEMTYYVRDNGAGFSEEHQDRLFGVFQRLHKNDDFPGTGIGLATVQRIIQKHEGRVYAHGRPGEGATFYFTLGKGEVKD